MTSFYLAMFALPVAILGVALLAVRRRRRPQR